MPAPVVNGQWVKGVGGAAVWAPITQADLPTNLQAGAADPTVANCNAFTATGWYWINSSVSNAPYANFNGFLQNYVAGWNSGYRSQFAFSYSDGFTYRRFCNNGAWSAWLLGGGDTDWITLPIVSPWSHYGGGATVFGVGQYRKTASGVVVLRGLLSNSAPASAQTICTFPSGYRPGSQDLFGVINNGGIARLDILTNGVLQLNTIFSGDNSSWMSVANVSWYATG